MTGLAIVTVVSRNHLHFAKALLASTRKHSIALPAYIVVIDGLEGVDKSEMTCDPNVKFVCGSELGIENWFRFAFQYTAFELACAIKPFAIRSALVDGYEKVIYLDADMQLYAPLDPVIQELEAGDVVLSSHCATPFPDDACLPNDKTVLSRGVFNAGFVAVRNSAAGHNFLEWLSRKCSAQCIVDTRAGLFVDQCWLDLVPTFFPTSRCSRHPGVNVGYWNLHERKISRDDNTYLSNGEPLVCFHFSGISMDSPNVLSRHQNRFQLVDFPVVAELLSNYLTLLKGCCTQGTEGIPYGLGFLSDGTKVKATWREAVRIAHPTLAGTVNPFDVSAQPKLVSILDEAAIDAVVGREDWKADPMRFLFRRLPKIPLAGRLWRNWVSHEIDRQ